MRLEYLRPGAAMMWTMPGATRARQIRIVIEELPDGMWDWTVWESQRPATSKFGVRATAASALADAVAAATTCCSRVSASPDMSRALDVGQRPAIGGTCPV
jgi:hypothetical protein